MNSKDIEQRLQELEAFADGVRRRNMRVERDKSWETSATRRFTIVVLTYLLTALVFYLIGVTSFLLSALIPTIGFYLSTLSLPVVKKIWLRKQ